MPIRLALTGDPAFRAEISTGMEKDMSQSVGGITFIVAGLMSLAFMVFSGIQL